MPNFKTTYTMKKAATALIILLTTITGFGQNHKIIEIDPITDMAKESLPFDQGFVLKKTYNEQIEIIGIGYYEIRSSELKNYFKTPRIADLNLKFNIEENMDKKFELYIYVPALKPQKFYDFLIVHKLEKQDKIVDLYIKLFKELHESNKENAQVTLLAINNEKRKSNDPFEHIDFQNGTSDITELNCFYFIKLKSLFDDVSLNDQQKDEKIRSEIMNSEVFKKGSWVTSTSEIFSFETRAKFRITPDFGYVNYGFQDDFNGITPYLGFQLEFRYFDKNIPFKLIPNKTILHRLSFNSGITLASLKKEGKREDFFANKSLMMGFGFRLSNALRITSGTILFNKEDPNPLIDNKKVAVTPYIGLSIDLGIRQLLNDLSGLIPLNRN